MSKYFTIQNGLKLVAVILLFYATSRNPYSYYIFLRWYVFLSCIYFAYLSKDETNKIWFILFTVIFLLFNPIIPIYFNKYTWTIIDITAGIIIFISIFLQNGGETKNQYSWFTFHIKNSKRSG